MSNKLYVIVWPDEGLATSATGTDAADAVKAHYAEQNAYCSPQDEDMHEEFSVVAYEIPSDLEENVRAVVEDATDDEAAAAFEREFAGRPSVTERIVDVVYTIRGADVSMSGTGQGRLFE